MTAAVCADTVTLAGVTVTAAGVVTLTSGSLTSSSPLNLYVNGVTDDTSFVLQLYITTARQSPYASSLIPGVVVFIRKEGCYGKVID